MTAVRVGVIGLGQIAQRSHLPALAAVAGRGDAVIQALCDLDATVLANTAREYGVEKAYTDAHAMLDREPLDALYLIVPPTCHTDIEAIAASRRLPILVEKPQSLDLEQARGFAREFARTGCITQVGFMSRYHPAAARAGELLAQRMPRHAAVQLFYSGAPLRYWTSRFELCGGSFVENSIHMVDLLRYFYGDIEAVSAFYVERRPGDPERGPMNVPHAYLVNYRFRSGLPAQFTTSRCLTDAGVTRREVLLVSEGSLIEWRPDRIVENGRTIWELSPVPDPFLLQTEAFIRAARENDPSHCLSPYGEALNSLEAVLGANVSAARDGKLIRLAEL